MRQAVDEVEFDPGVTWLPGVLEVNILITQLSIAWLAGSSHVRLA